MQKKEDQQLSDIMETLSAIKNEFASINKRLDLITPTKPVYDPTPIGTKAFDMAMQNLEIDNDDLTTPPKRNPRRTTIYENSMKFQEPHINESSIQMLYSPVQSDLLLTHLTVSAVLFFMDKFRMLQQKQRNIPLLLGDFLHLSVSEELVAKDNDIDYSDLVIGNVLRLKNEIVYSMIVKSITPRNKEIFMQQMNKNSKFPNLPDGYIVSASYYQPMAKALVEFRGKFTTLWDLLTTFIDYPLPQLRTKGFKKGILSTFVDAILQNHGVKILQSMNYEQLKTMIDIKKDFFPVFFAIVRQITKQSNIVKDLNFTMDMSFTNQNKKELSENKKQSPSPFKHLSTVTDDMSPTYDSEDELMTSNKNLFYQQYESMKTDIINESLSFDDNSHNLSNLVLPKEKVILPCYTMLRTGKCIKGASCTYNHTKNDLIKAWQDMFSELKASPFNPNKHLLPGNTKIVYNTPSTKNLQSIVEDIATPDISEQS